MSPCKVNDIYFCRATFPISTEATFRAANATQTYQLWTSVSSALCGCVNNPQNGNMSFVFCVSCSDKVKCKIQIACYSGNNFQYSIKCLFGASTKAVFCSVISFFCIAEEGQRICVAAFPVIKIWLQQLTFPQTEIFQPICTFIAMTVANNCKC